VTLHSREHIPFSVAEPIPIEWFGGYPLGEHFLLLARGTQADDVHRFRLNRLRKNPMFLKSMQFSRIL
jgi:hypothetical protein